MMVLLHGKHEKLEIGFERFIQTITKIDISPHQGVPAVNEKSPGIPKANGLLDQTHQFMRYHSPINKTNIPIKDI